MYHRLQPKVSNKHSPAAAAGGVERKGVSQARGQLRAPPVRFEHSHINPHLLLLLQVSVNGQVSPELLVNHVYRLYGLDAEELNVDFFSFTGDALKIGSPRLAQVGRW
jgi:hypothetical protein